LSAFDPAKAPSKGPLGPIGAPERFGRFSGKKGASPVLELAP
jgi:hypothetical protein